MPVPFFKKKILLFQCHSLFLSLACGPTLMPVLFFFNFFFFFSTPMTFVCLFLSLNGVRARSNNSLLFGCRCICIYIYINIYICIYIYIYINIYFTTGLGCELLSDCVHVSSILWVGLRNSYDYGHDLHRTGVANVLLRCC